MKGDAGVEVVRLGSRRAKGLLHDEGDSFVVTYGRGPSAFLHREPIPDRESPDQARRVRGLTDAKDRAVQWAAAYEPPQKTPPEPPPAEPLTLRAKVRQAGEWLDRAEALRAEAAELDAQAAELLA